MRGERLIISTMILVHFDLVFGAIHASCILPVCTKGCLELHSRFQACHFHFVLTCEFDVIQQGLEHT